MAKTPSDLSDTDLRVLAAIRELGPCRPGELDAAAARVSAGTRSRTIRRLADLELVTATKSRVEITPLGRYHLVVSMAPAEEGVPVVEEDPEHPGWWRSTLDPRVVVHASRLERWGPGTRELLEPAIRALRAEESRLEKLTGAKPRRGRLVLPPRTGGADDSRPEVAAGTAGSPKGP